MLHVLGARVIAVVTSAGRTQLHRDSSWSEVWEGLIFFFVLHVTGTASRSSEHVVTLTSADDKKLV